MSTRLFVIHHISCYDIFYDVLSLLEKFSKFGASFRVRKDQIKLTHHVRPAADHVDDDVSAATSPRINFTTFRATYALRTSLRKVNFYYTLSFAYRLIQSKLHACVSRESIVALSASIQFDVIQIRVHNQMRSRT